MTLYSPYLSSFADFYLVGTPNKTSWTHSNTDNNISKYEYIGYSLSKQLFVKENIFENKYYRKEAAKKVIFSVAWRLKGGGGLV